MESRLVEVESIRETIYCRVLAVGAMCSTLPVGRYDMANDSCLE